ncbi:MAG: hypothetical protein ABIP48_04440 [Planctomycetota bacterium]
MARILAVDWDQHEARYVLGATAGGKVTVDAIESVPLVDVAEGGAEPHPDLAGSLTAAMSNLKLGRTPVLVGVERSSIELLHFTLPPAKDSELPELVVNQAMHESQLVSEQSVLDFLPLGDDPTTPRNVICAALSPGEMERICQTCEAAGLKPTRMLLRPFASASLFVQTATPAEAVYLLVSRITDQVDLIIVVDGKPVFFRTVRLPEGVGEDQATARLLAEINRTLAAAPQSHLRGETVECIYIFGRSDDHRDLIEQIRGELLLPARVFDPFEALRVPEERTPEDCGRFAPLLGMLLDEAAGSHAVDFLHPRKMPQPVNRVRIAATCAGVLAVAILGVAYNTWSTWSEINGENQVLAERVRDLKETGKKAAQRQKLIDAVSQWQARDVIWLDELRDLSLRFPSTRDVVVSRMLLSSSQSSGSISVEGLLRSPDVLVKLENQVRDPYRRVRSKRVQQQKAEKDYAWVFETSLSVRPRGETRDRNRYVSHLPEEELLLAAEEPAAKEPAVKSETLADAGTPKKQPTVKKASQ